MKREELLEHISIDPQICFGKPCIRGTRIWVSLVVDNLAENVSESELLAAYPQLTPKDIRAAVEYFAATEDVTLEGNALDCRTRTDTIS